MSGDFIQVSWLVHKVAFSYWGSDVVRKEEYFVVLDSNLIINSLSFDEQFVSLM